MIPDIGALIGGLATAAAAGGGLVLTAGQIRLAREGDERSNRWRRVEFVRSVVDKLYEDEEVQFCLRALDWGVGPLPIPSCHKILFADPHFTIEQDTSKMERALQVSLPSDFRDPEILVYRHSFDHFFSVIENIITYGDRLGDEFVDDIGLSYYKKLIKSPPYLGKNGGKSPLHDFIEEYYNKVHSTIWA